MNRSIKAGLTGYTDAEIRIVGNDGEWMEDVDFETDGLVLWYCREGGDVVTFAPAELATLDGSYVSGGICHKADGLYRIHVPNAAIAAGARGVRVCGSVPDGKVIGCYIDLVAYDSQDDEFLGLSGLEDIDTAVDQMDDQLDEMYTTGVELAATGFDNISANMEAGRPTTFRGWLMWLARFFGNKRVKVTDDTLTLFGDDDTTEVTEQALVGSGANQTVGQATSA